MEHITGYQYGECVNVFEDKEEFNDNISEWNLNSVTNMSFMFYGARSFNGDISGLNVSSVTNMSGMFYYTRSFNGDISR